MLNDGTYKAVANRAVIWEATSGALMATFDFQLTDEGFEGQTIKGQMCLVQKDNTISEISCKNLKACFKWDGLDFFQLEEEGFLVGKQVELVIEQETYEGKTRSVVKYINAPGGGMPEPADRAKVTAKYASRLRAMAGAASKPAPKKSTPTQSKPPAPRQLVTPVGPTSSMEECWSALVDMNPGKSEEEVNDLWYLTLDKLFPGKDNSELTPQQWGQVRTEIGDKLPY